MLTGEMLKHTVFCTVVMVVHRFRRASGGAYGHDAEGLAPVLLFWLDSTPLSRTVRAFYLQMRSS